MKPSGGFDTRLAGTADEAWRSMLAMCALLKPLDPGVLILAPHPDDESLATGGLQQHYPDARVIIVTDGEAARRVIPNLACRRRREARAARRQLGLSTRRLWFLGLPDGQIASHEPRLERLLTAHLSGVRTLIAPFEYDGHTDHDSVGRVSRRLARRHRLHLLRYLIWGWHRYEPDQLRDARFERLRLNDAQRRAKQRAIACFRTQLEGGDQAVVPPHVLTYFARPYEAFLSGELA
jgi:LmbE family N-acetylglucosaminyl deacetylase